VVHAFDHGPGVDWEPGLEDVQKEVGELVPIDFASVCGHELLGSNEDTATVEPGALDLDLDPDVHV
jgi:hypothetical protein